MTINEYSFGKIVVDGRTYKNDIIIRLTSIKENWWRQAGHELAVDDIKDVIEEDKPDVFIMGTGKFGIVKILSETRDFLGKNGVELIAVKSNDAVAKYNELSLSKKVVAGFHLTC